MKKLSLFCFLLILLSYSLICEEQIEEAVILPEVSTEISGGAPKAGKSAVPDYSEIVPEKQTNAIVPKMSDAGADENQSFSALLKKDAADKQIFIQGTAGGGYPNLVDSDFSIYREDGLSPFNINFEHKELNGYARNTESEGFFNKYTFIGGKKSYKFEKMLFSGVASYYSNNYGLQSKGNGVTDLTDGSFLIKGKSFFDLKKDFFIKVDFTGNLYSRFGNVSANADENCKTAAQKNNILFLNPVFSLGLEKQNGFYSQFDFDYINQSEILKHFEGESSQNRFAFNLHSGLKKDLFDLFLDASIVTGNNLGLDSVVVPFDAGVNLSLENKLSSRNILLSLKGGLDSRLSLIENLHSSNIYCSLFALPFETSDWFFSSSFSLPVKALLTFKLNADFAKTALNNGIYVAQHTKENFYYGQYGFLYEDKTRFDTNFDVSFNHGLFGLDLSWKAHWIDLVGWEKHQMLKLLFSIHSPSSKILFKTDVSYSLDSLFYEEEAYIPLVGFEFDWKITNAVRLALRGNDIVNLISGYERKWDDLYICESGSIGAFIKFLY